MHILLIDDDQTILDTLAGELADRDMKTTAIQSFTDAGDLLRDKDVDIVVLDLMESGDKRPGLDILQSLLQGHFLPLIVYSARIEWVDQVLEGPFLKVISKSGEGDTAVKVCDTISEFRPHVEAIQSLKADLYRTLGQVLYRSASLVWAATASHETEKTDILRRCAKRHIAAGCDPLPGEKLESWERYLYPPIGDSLMQADLLRLKGTDQDPSSFRLVLTPTCDLVLRKQPEVRVLTAVCEPMAKFEAAIGLQPGGKLKARREKVMKHLSHPQTSGYVPVPMFGNVVPSMVANLKNLEVMRHSAAGTFSAQMGAFERIVSIDSPFREQCAWAYVEIAGRVGVPDSNLDSWVEAAVREPDAQ